VFETFCHLAVAIDPKNKSVKISSSIGSQREEDGSEGGEGEGGERGGEGGIILTESRV